VDKKLASFDRSRPKMEEEVMDNPLNKTQLDINERDRFLFLYLRIAKIAGKSLTVELEF
jgi:hypothetical protein